MGAKSMKLYVGQLPYSTTNEDLARLFEQYGEVISASIITDRETGRNRGFGFVEMNDADAQKAMSELNGKPYEGRTLVVNEANERPPRRDSGGGRGGYGGGGRGGYGGGGGGGYDRGGGGGGRY
jgi:cold-inducible RNA-binding protein